MHHRLFVLIDAYKFKTSEEKIKKGETIEDIAKKNRVLVIKSSLEAREAVSDFLSEEGWVDQKRFSSGVGDWFVIGGRWSSILTTELLNPILWQACNEELREDKDSSGVNKYDVSQKQKEYADKIFYKYFPKFKGETPYHRDSFHHMGCKDDAKLVTTSLWNKLLRKHVEDCKNDPYEDPIIYVEDSETSELTKKDIVQKMYCVIVDWHS